MVEFINTFYYLATNKQSFAMQFEGIQGAIQP